MNLIRLLGYRNSFRAPSEFELYVYLQLTVHVNDQAGSSLSEEARSIGLKLVLPDRKSWK
jgi:hypothetical protein